MICAFKNVAVVAIALIASFKVVECVADGEGYDGVVWSYPGKGCEVGADDIISVTGGVEYIPEGDCGLPVGIEQLPADAEIDKPEGAYPSLCGNGRAYEISV